MVIKILSTFEVHKGEEGRGDLNTFKKEQLYTKINILLDGADGVEDLVVVGVAQDVGQGRHVVG